MSQENNSQIYTISGNVDQLMKHPDLFAHFHRRKIDDHLRADQLKELDPKTITILANRTYADFVNIEDAQKLYNEMNSRNLVALRNYLV